LVVIHYYIQSVRNKASIFISNCIFNFVSNWLEWFVVIN